MSENPNIIEDSIDRYTNESNQSGLYDGMPNIDPHNLTDQTTNAATNLPLINCQFNPDALSSGVYIEKKGYKKDDFFGNHWMDSQIRNTSLELFKYYEIYCLPTIIKEFNNKQKYKDIVLTKSRNYIPKALCVINIFLNAPFVFS